MACAQHAGDQPDTTLYTVNLYQKYILLHLHYWQRPCAHVRHSHLTNVFL